MFLFSRQGLAGDGSRARAGGADWQLLAGLGGGSCIVDRRCCLTVLSHGDSIGGDAIFVVWVRNTNVAQRSQAFEEIEVVKVISVYDSMYTKSQLFKSGKIESQDKLTDLLTRGRSETRMVASPEGQRATTGQRYGMVQGSYRYVVR